MNISDIESNMLVEDISGIISSIVVTRISMLIQIYVEKLKKTLEKCAAF